MARLQLLRASLARRLARRRTRRLIKVLGQPGEASRRREAAAALGASGDPRAAAALGAAVRDAEVHEVAVAGLVGLWRGLIVTPLLGVLEEGPWTDDNPALAALERVGWRPEPDVHGAIYWICARRWERCAEIGEPAVEPLVEVLRGADHATREAVIRALVRIGEASTEACVASLTGPVEVSDAAARVLEQTGWEPGEDLHAAYYLLRRRHWDRLVALGPLAIDPLVRSLDHEDREGRLAVTESLGRIGKAAVPNLLGALKHDEPRVRLAAARALGMVGERSSCKPLCAALKDRDPGVRDEAARALGLMGDSSAVGALLDAFRRAPSGPVAEALGRIGDPRAVPTLVEGLGSDKAQSMVAKALGDLGDSRAVGALCGLVERGRTPVRVNAVVALGRIGDEGAVNALTYALRSDESVDARRAAARALGELRSPLGVDALLGALGSEEHDWVRRAAAEALVAMVDRMPGAARRRVWERREELELAGFEWPTQLP